MKIVSFIHFTIKNVTSCTAENRQLFDIFGELLPNGLMYLVLSYFYAAGFFINWGIDAPI
jgi:hypothetical protein